MKSLPILFVCLLLLTACATGKTPEAGNGHGHLKPHYEHSLFQITEQGLFSVEMLVKGDTMTVGLNDLDLIVHRDVEGNRDVEGAEITVEPWMPTMGHGVKPKPVIVERGAGLYSVKGLKLTMPGLWELRISIRAAGSEDRAVFTFAEVEAPRGPHGATPSTGHDAVSRNLDLSTTRMSGAGRFRVAFESLETSVPLNVIHSWELTVKDQNDVPVRGARITVDGAMPDHDHGLPTRPLVTREIDPGVYLVEGMKFQMPGWWTVTFTIHSGAGDDTVTFNLQL